MPQPVQEEILLPEITGLKMISGDSNVVLKWHVPADPRVKGVRVVRRTRRAPSDSTDGFIVCDVDRSVTAVRDTALENGVMYFYRLFTTGSASNYSDGIPAIATPIQAPDGAPPSDAKPHPPAVRHPVEPQIPMPVEELPNPDNPA